MKIKLLIPLAIHEVQRETIPAGTSVEVPDALAAKLVERGLATKVKSAGAKRAPAVANKKAAPLSNKARVSKPRKR